MYIDHSSVAVRDGKKELRLDEVDWKTQLQLYEFLQKFRSDQSEKESNRLLVAHSATQ